MNKPPKSKYCSEFLFLPCSIDIYCMVITELTSHIPRGNPRYFLLIVHCKMDKVGGESRSLISVSSLFTAPGGFTILEIPQTHIQ